MVFVIVLVTHFLCCHVTLRLAKKRRERGSGKHCDCSARCVSVCIELGELVQQEGTWKCLRAGCDPRGKCTVTIFQLFFSRYFHYQTLLSLRVLPFLHLT